MKRVLVTGCNGFVGRVLTDTLADRGVDVWGTDRVQLDEEYRGSGFEAADLTKTSHVRRVLDTIQPGLVVHLAAQSSAGLSLSEPHETIHNNVLPVLHLLEYLRTSGKAMRMLAVGSADVYGAVTEADLPLSETLAPTPRNPYALSKAIQEQCCERFASLYGVDVVSTRSFNHTGAGQRDTFVMSSFAKQIAAIKAGRKDAVVEVGNVDVRRDFSDVRDVCGAYLALLEHGHQGEVYNVCSGVSHSLRQLLTKLAALAGVDVEIRTDPGRVRRVDMEELRGDRSKIEAHTGWRPEIPIDDTLRSLLDYWVAAGVSEA